jgi:hypothetical protein
MPPGAGRACSPRNNDGLSYRCPHQAEAVTLFASVEASRAARDPDDDAAKHAFAKPGSLVKIAQLLEMNRSGSLKVGPRGGVVRHPGGLIRHRMPLRGEFLPFQFGGAIGCAFGAFLAPNRFQVIFLGQIKLGGALICGHSAAP